MLSFIPLKEDYPFDPAVCCYHHEDLWASAPVGHTRDPDYEAWLAWRESEDGRRVMDPWMAEEGQTSRFA